MRVRRKNGDVLLIEVNGCEYFGRVLEEPFVAFYEYSDDGYTVDEVVRRKIIFTVAVTNSAITRGRWKVVGNVPLHSDLQEPIKTFRQDDTSGKLFIITGRNEMPASVEDCIGLERAAVWDPEHVEERLYDAKRGVENKWVKQLSLKMN